MLNFDLISTSLRFCVIYSTQEKAKGNSLPYLGLLESSLSGVSLFLSMMEVVDGDGMRWQTVLFYLL